MKKRNVMFWGNTTDAYHVPVPASPNVSDFIQFTGKPKSVLLNTLPNMYQLP